MNQHAVELRHLKKSFNNRVPSARSLMGAVRSLIAPVRREHRAVDGVSFCIEPGERVAFIGPNGAGERLSM